MSLPPAPLEDDESKFPRPYAESQAAAPLDDQPSPPLSIQHLFLWTTCLAIAAGTTMAIARQPFAPTIDPAMIVFALLFIFVRGTCLAAAVLWVVRRFLQIPFPTQPGHWLLLGLFIVELGSFVTLLPFLFWAYGIVSALAALVFGLAARSLFSWRAWQVFFVALAIIYGASAVAILLPWILVVAPFARSNLWIYLFWAWAAFIYVTMFAALAAWVAGIVLDHLHGARRDWLHALGVAMPAVAFLGLVAQYVAAMLMRG